MIPRDGMAFEFAEARARVDRRYIPERAGVPSAVYADTPRRAVRRRRWLPTPRKATP